MLQIRKPFIFVRHPESLGQTLSQDERAELPMSPPAYPITPLGKQQVKTAFHYLARQYHPSVIRECYCSTALRTKQGLDIGLQYLNTSSLSIVPIEDSRLDEKNEGIFRELSEADVELLYPGQTRLRERVGYYHFIPINGESCPQVEMRIRSFVADHLAEPYADREGYVLVMGHGHWFQIFQRLVHNMTIEEFMVMKDSSVVDNCSITVYTPNDRKQGLRGRPETIVPWQGMLAASQGSV